MIDCLPYYGVFSLVFVMNCLAMRQKNVGLKRCLILLGFMILLVFIGFRYNVGTDYDNYLRIYNNIADASWENIFSFNIEPVVSIIFKFCSMTLMDARLIMVVLGLLMLWPIYKVNKLYDYKYLAYSVLVYCVLFFPFGLNGMRQGVAMSFALLAFVYIYKKKLTCSAIYLIIATLFHTSAMIIVPYAFAICLNRWKGVNFTRLNLLFTGSISVIVLFFLNNILTSGGFTQYEYILGSIDIGNTSLIDAIVYAPIVVLTLCLGRGGDESDENVISKNLVLSGVFFSVIGSAAQYLSRFSLFFLMPSVILLPQLVQGIRQKNTRIIVKCLLIVYLVGFFYLQYAVWGKHEILPYQTWIFGGSI